MLRSRLPLDSYGLFKMVFDCLWVVLDVFEVVVEFFEVLVLCCRSFLLLQFVTTPRFELTSVLPRNDKQMFSK